MTETKWPKKCFEVQKTQKNIQNIFPTFFTSHIRTNVWKNYFSKKVGFLVHFKIGIAKILVSVEKKDFFWRFSPKVWTLQTTAMLTVLLQKKF